MRAKTLRVLPNPWLHIHVYDDGVPRPCAAVGVDMVEHVPDPNRYIGARIAKVAELTAEKSFTVKGKKVVTQPSRDERFWEFSAEPETIPNTGYYRDRLKSGELLAADEASAKAAGIEFVNPADALAAAKDKAIANFNATYGEGAFADAQPVAVPETHTAAPAEPSKRTSKER